MKLRYGVCLALGIGASVSIALAQQAAPPPPDSYEGHLWAAKQAAGYEFTGTLSRLCITPQTSAGSSSVKASDPTTWYAEPVKLFDNLYWLGTKIHNSFALVNNDGIIIIDTLYNYASGPEIVEGLKKVGLDPKNVKYVIVSHGHSDHDEGAKMLQDAYGARVVLGGGDWDLIEKAADMPGGKPKRDIVATDGQKITVGDNTVTIVTTPGHTAGTLSYVFTVKDKGKPMTVAYSGGTSNIPLVNDPEGLTQYINSQQKIAKAAAAAGASILMSNHTEFDGAWIKVRLLAARKPGDPHPYDVGTDGVQRYFKMAAECAMATRMKALGTAK